MKIKVLIVPTLIIASGFVTFQYLKPDFDVYMEKRAERAIAQENASKAEATAKNVSALKEELETQKEKVSFVKRYVPHEKDEARMFDSLNFLTGQTGLLASKIQILEVAEEETGADQAFATVDPVATADPMTLLPTDPNALPGLQNAAMPYKAPKVRTYAVSLEALGGYGNIKDLVKKLTEFDRLQEVQSFKIAAEVTESSEGEEEATNSGTLVLTYETHLPYQAKPTLVSGEALVSIPGLNQSSFDFTATEALKAKAATAPDIVLGTDGKANPFE